MSARDVHVERGRLTVGSAAAVSTLLVRGVEPSHLCVLAHGAGAGMEHPFMRAMAERLAAHGIATLRYQFPYTESGRRRPDPPALLQATVRAAVEAAGRHGLPLLAGGKSMGGRMTSLAASEAPLPGVEGLVFLGFPLHPAGQPASQRGEHLARTGLPMLFLQGTRDALADLTLLEPLCRKLAGATLHVVEGADHGFHVPKKSGRTDAQVIEDLAGKVASWAAAQPRAPIAAAACSPQRDSSSQRTKSSADTGREKR